MLHERPALERRLLAALDAEPARIPVVLGGCGSGRTSLLARVAARLGDRRCRYIDVERIASTPERFAAAVIRDLPPTADAVETPLPGGRGAPRAAFEALLAFLGRRGGARPVLLFDEWLDLRTLESFPGLRGALREIVEVLVRSPRRFVLASRFVTRTRRLLHDVSSRVELVHLPPLSPSEVASALPPGSTSRNDSMRAELGRLVHALAAGRPGYVGALAAAVSSRGGQPGDPVGALAAQMAAGAPLSRLCRFSYELRLHRARGYGVLKAVLGILADTEPLTLTRIARALGRTPGSTKDYLSWLADVDLVETRAKRYRFTDPLLRLWVRLHGGTAAPGERERVREAREYAAARIACREASPAATPFPPGVPPATAAPPREVPPRRPRNLIEID